jgi:hypothetical protein
MTSRSGRAGLIAGQQNRDTAPLNGIFGFEDVALGDSAVTGGRYNLAAARHGQ